MRCEKGAIAQNMEVMEKYISKCHENNVDIVCFPEMNITGYNDPNRYADAVLTLDHHSIKKVIELSNTYSICIVAGFIEYNPNGKPFITQIAVQNGKLLNYYHKITVKDEEAEWFSPGEAISIFESMGVKIGLSICADIDDPEIFKAYSDNGVSIVLECAAPGLYGDQKTRNWESGFNWWKNNCIEKLGKYAADNAIYIGVSTQAGRTIDEDFPGGGYVFNSEGKCIYETDDWAEGALYAVIELNS